MTAHFKSRLKVGQVFAHLTVLCFSYTGKGYRRYYRVKCDCGTEKSVRGCDLQAGRVSSCGCLTKSTPLSRSLPDDAGPIRRLIRRYRRQALERDLEFTLSTEHVTTLFRSPCHYCGDLASNSVGRPGGPDFKYNGIDRMNPTIGYVADNVVGCCRTCNYAKSDRSYTDFMEWITRLTSHSAQRRIT